MSYYKIEMPTAKDLKNLAKERGFRGFHNLRKAELSRLLEVKFLLPKKTSKILQKKEDFGGFII